jgi:cytochrome b involved in lipid metabolism
VYDVSAFMAEHPGGEDVLMASTGERSSPIFHMLYILAE